MREKTVKKEPKLSHNVKRKFNIAHLRIEPPLAVFMPSKELMRTLIRIIATYGKNNNTHELLAKMAF